MLQKLFSATAPVDRRTYAMLGFGLMAFKYLVEVLVLKLAIDQWLSPAIFLTPSMGVRQQIYEAAPQWMGPAYALWTLPFVWVGASMTVRRARDAGLGSWFGLLFFAPLINMLVMIALCFAPTRSADPQRGSPLQGSDRVVWAALTGVSLGALIAVVMVLFSVFVLGSYGGTLFMGTPFVMGVVTAFFLNLRAPRSAGLNLLAGAATVAISGGLLLLFALEGALCLAMAFPLAIALSWMGVWLGRALAGLEARRSTVAPVFMLPLLAVLEPAPAPLPLHEVKTVIDIAASPQVVWDNVIGFGGVQLDPPPEWFFQLGIAYPTHAHIEGEGPGAVRHCEFSTGPFVEPITVWDEPHHLAFDVSQSPPTMHEWSPYDTVFAPHLDTVLKSQHGEFRLVPIEGGGTRLEGTTWYTFDMAPAVWWTLWSDASIHYIHLRVLRHIKVVSEQRAG